MEGRADGASLAAAKLPAYSKLIDTAVEFGKSKSSDPEEQAENAMDRLLVEFGVAILKEVPGRVSTEVDAAFSFDKREYLYPIEEAASERALRIHWCAYGCHMAGCRLQRMPYWLLRGSLPPWWTIDIH